LFKGVEKERMVMNNIPWGLADIDEIFDVIFSSDAFKTVSKLPDCLVSASYPPTNIYTDKDKNYIIQVAVAGWSDDEVSLNFEDMKLVLELNPSDEPDLPDYFQKGIRHSHTKITYGLHPRYDTRAVKAVKKDGILTITLPVKEEAKPSTVTINKE
jgi:HSP20 family molecular chaperone IbpA